MNIHQYFPHRHPTMISLISKHSYQFDWFKMVSFCLIWSRWDWIFSQIFVNYVYSFVKKTGSICITTPVWMFISFYIFINCLSFLYGRFLINLIASKFGYISKIIHLTFLINIQNVHNWKSIIGYGIPCFKTVFKIHVV